MSIYVKIRMYTYVYIGGETYVYSNIKNIGVIYAYTYVKYHGHLCVIYICKNPWRYTIKIIMYRIYGAYNATVIYLAWHSQRHTTQGKYKCFILW